MTDTPRSLEWLKRLVSVDTTSRNSNVEIITMIADALRAAGVEPQVFDDPKSEQTGVHKQGVVATIPASDGGTSGGVVLSGHTDVVPVDGQKWTSDPFTVTERDGKYYGRGVADMKSFIAVILTLLPELTKAQLKQPIHLAFSYDEEVACLGGDEIVKQLNDRGAKPVGAIIGEPSSMRVVKAHKSVNLYEVTFHGVAAHSSLTAQGVNAIEYAARLVTWWREVTDCWKSEGPWDDAYSLKWSTGGVNQFHGGTAVNIVPATATVLLEFRSIAEVDDDQVLAQTRAYCDQLRREMQAENPDADIDFQVQAIVPGLDTPADADIVTIAQDAGGLPCDDKVTYGTEGGQFSNGGIPAVVCGPGDIGQAHTPDEWLDPQQLLDCEQFVLKLAENLSK